MVSHLQQLDAGQPASDELRIDALLDVARQEEPMPGDLAQEDDGDVVDGRPVIARFEWHRPRVGPQDVQADVVHAQPIAGPERPARDADDGQRAPPGLVSRARTVHPRLVDALDIVAFEEERQAPDVVLVGMAEDDGVDVPIPRREMVAQRNEEPPRVGAAVHQQATSATTFDEDRVPLTDVEDDDPGDAVRSVSEGERDGDDRGDERQRGHTGEPRAGPGLVATTPSAPRRRRRDGSPVGIVPATLPQHPPDPTRHGRSDQDPHA
jgi:hypothetical protein